MSDENSSGDTTDEFERRVEVREGDGVVTQAEIDDVLGDPSLSLAEREARLADLRQRILDDEYARGDEEYAPLQTRIMDALSMLAEGGHDYDGTRHVEGERSDDDPSSPRRRGDDTI